MSATASRWVKRFNVTVSIMVAAVTILSAVIAWRAALAGDEAGNADFAGIGAALSREESRTLNSATAYQQYRAFTAYLRNNEIGNAIADDLDDSAMSFDDTERAFLASQRSASWDQTLVDDDFFETRYLRSDGSYDLQRQLSEREAEDALQKDIDPAPHFATADQRRAKSNLLVGMLIIMACALWFFTMAGEFHHAIRYPLAFLGTLCLLIGVIGTIAIEVIA